jgi:hypothetical protein
MNDSSHARTVVDRAARRNYLILCGTATLVLVALVALAVVIL